MEEQAKTKEEELNLEDTKPSNFIDDMVDAKPTDHALAKDCYNADSQEWDAERLLREYDSMKNEKEAADNKAAGFLKKQSQGTNKPPKDISEYKIPDDAPDEIKEAIAHLSESEEYKKTLQLYQAADLTKEQYAVLEPKLMQLEVEMAAAEKEKRDNLPPLTKEERDSLNMEVSEHLGDPTGNIVPTIKNYLTRQLKSGVINQDDYDHIKSLTDVGDYEPKDVAKTMRALNKFRLTNNREKFIPLKGEPGTFNASDDQLPPDTVLQQYFPTQAKLRENPRAKEIWNNIVAKKQQMGRKPSSGYPF